MDIGNHWKEIKQTFRECYKSTAFYSVATVSADGTPHAAPIGGLFLKENNMGFFLDIFLSKTTKNLVSNQRICVLAVNCSKLFWLKSLFRGTFNRPSAVRLYGTVGERREATKEEQSTFRAQIKPLRKFKGYNLLWKDLKYARDIHFDSFEPVNLGKMSSAHWKN